MDARKALEIIGLSEGETKVYMSLLKLGSVPVSKVKEDTQLHRTTIYDFVESLINKGLASYVVKNNIKFYQAAHPSKLSEFIKEKEELVKEVIPDLTKLAEIEKEEIKVETYKGVEGFKTLLNDVIRVGKDMVGFGIDETKFKERFPILIEKHFKNEERIGMKERLLSSENTKFIYKKLTASYRFIPDQYFNPTPTIVYGDRVAIMVWEPLTIVIIKNSELADSYRKHFELLWKMAKLKPKHL